jgi:hypothetical protein
MFASSLLIGGSWISTKQGEQSILDNSMLAILLSLHYMTRTVSKTKSIFCVILIIHQNLSRQNAFHDLPGPSHDPNHLPHVPPVFHFNVETIVLRSNSCCVLHYMFAFIFCCRLIETHDFRTFDSVRDEPVLPWLRKRTCVRLPKHSSSSICSKRKTNT